MRIWSKRGEHAGLRLEDCLGRFAAQSKLYKCLDAAELFIAIRRPLLCAGWNEISSPQRPYLPRLA